jgi:hypothetical protein
MKLRAHLPDIAVDDFGGCFCTKKMGGRLFLVQYGIRYTN